ncbi:malate dehydrogenase [Sporosarcina soli]|uniref:Malate dehydrogenase n=1 Tax=Sporosarcina soli TaxID=334736 RepID=A0ABW0TD07_9BACL
MKISIIGGAGTLGAAIAFRLCQNDQVDELCLIDVNESLLMNHLMDLKTAYPAKTIYKGNFQDLTGSQLILITAGVPNRNDIESRNIFLRGNIPMFQSFGTHIKKYASDAFIITVSNPVDALNYYLYRNFDFKKGQLLGYTVNDSLRFEQAIRSVMEISEDAHLFSPVIGEHGSTQVPLFSQTRLNGNPLALKAEDEVAIKEKLNRWFIEFNRLNINRTTGWATAAGIGRLIDGIVTNGEVDTIGSAIVEGEYGIVDISIGVPVTVSKVGVISIHEWQLAKAELADYQHSAETIKQLIKPFIR